MEVDEVELSESEATKFRGLAARVNFLAQDCPDLQFPAKEVCCHTSFPTFASWARLKPLARYSVTRKAVIPLYERQDEGKLTTLHTDRDWAGCRRTRKSTSGRAVLIGTNCVKTWSCTQGPIALSSAEAEYNSMVEGTIMAKGVLLHGSCARMTEFLLLDTVAWLLC